MAKKRMTLRDAIAENDWQTEDDFRTMLRAKEIESDPKRLAKVKEFAKKKLEETASVMAEASEKSS